MQPTSDLDRAFVTHPSESNLKPGNKAKQSNKHFNKVYKNGKVTRLTRRYAANLRPGKNISYLLSLRAT